MMAEETRTKHSAFSEWLLLTRQSAAILFTDKKNLILSMVFPVVAAFITVWIAGEDMFVTFEGTKSACFVVVSAAIWGGLFNSIQVVVKERSIIRRNMASGMILRSYTAAKATVQFLLCLVQSMLLTCSFIGVQWRFGNELPEHGVIFSSALAEYFITVFVLTYAADAMGLFLSSLVKKPETANVMAPYILIVQLIFSGVLFTMEGAANWLSYAMFSRWGMEALGSISDLNALPLAIQMTVPTVPHETDDMFLRTQGHLLTVWLILAGFAAAFLLLGDLFLHRAAKDSR